MKRASRGALAGILLLALALGLGGCGAGYADNPFDQQAGGEETIQVTIRNRNFNDATVRIIWSGGYRERLGQVTGASNETFTIRMRSERISFEIDFIGGGGYTTGSINVSPGDHVRYDIRS